MKLEIIKCPTCGGSLTVTNGMDIVECAYCDNAVRVRESLLLMKENRSGNFLEMAKSSLEARNYDESLRYANKALESEINNPQANEIKALICFEAYYDDEEKLNEGLYYAIKALNNYTGKEKKESREIIHKKLLETDFHREQIPMLTKIYNVIGGGDKRILLKIMDISYSNYLLGIKHGNEYRDETDIRDYNEALKTLLQTDATEYQAVVKKQTELYKEALKFRKSELDAENRIIFKRNIKATFAVAIFANLFISGALERIFEPEGNGAIIIVFFSILGVLYLALNTYIAKEQTKDYEIKRYGENLIYK